MSERRRITRREFLYVSTLVTAGAIATACGGKATEPATKEPEVVAPEATTAPPAAGAKYKEAPELAAMVAAGTLPPVDERLPLEPFVVGPGSRVWEDDIDWEVGRYSEGPDEVLRTVTYEWFLNTPPHHIGPITPGLAASWSMNDDATEYNLTLRKGLKWSDGEPVTTKDVEFGWNEWMLNPELVASPSRAYRAGYKAGADIMNVEIVDDYTVKITFTAPNARFLTQLGMGSLWGSYTWLMKPRHYMEQFHKAFAVPAELSAKLSEAGLTEAEWYRFALDKDFTGGGCPTKAIGYPVLTPYKVIEHPDDLIIIERNPYYWRVDTEGQQLPYVGRTESVVLSSVDNIPATIVNGEINWCREILQHTDVALYKENEANNAYSVNLDLVYHNAPVALFFNLTGLDPVWNEIAQKKEFRHAVNAAIDLEEIIQVLFLGMGKLNPWIPEKYDAVKAAALFDECGLDKKDADGWRLGPDGNRFEFKLDVALDPLWVKPGEVIKSRLEEIGIYVPMKSMEPTLWSAMRDANELKATIDWLDDCNWPFLKNDYLPEQRCLWAQEWEKYMKSNGAEGQEPAAWMQKLYDLETQLVATAANTDAGQTLWTELQAWLTEYVPMIPLARDVADPLIVPDKVGNMAKSGRSSAVWFAQEQVFFKK
jgi:peptide/nickel transport system substrate-binding protein